MKKILLRAFPLLLIPLAVLFFQFIPQPDRAEKQPDTAPQPAARLAGPEDPATNPGKGDPALLKETPPSELHEFMEEIKGAWCGVDGPETGKSRREFRIEFKTLFAYGTIPWQSVPANQSGPVGDVTRSTLFPTGILNHTLYLSDGVAYGPERGGMIEKRREGLQFTGSHPLRVVHLTRSCEGFWSEPLPSPSGTAQKQAGGDNPAKDFFDRLFIVGSPEKFSCEKNGVKTGATFKLPPDTDLSDFNWGDPFYLVKNADAPALIKAKLVRLLSPCYENPIGLLETSEEIVWQPYQESDWNRSTLFLAIKGAAPPLERIGSVKKAQTMIVADLPPVDLAYWNQMKPHIPEGRRLHLFEETVISPPNSKETYVEIGIGHSDPRNDEMGGDEGVFTRFLFVREAAGPRLLLQGEEVPKVLAISDLDGDGLYEVLVDAVADNYGSYEIRLFDGKGFSEPKRVLYKWVIWD